MSKLITASINLKKVNQSLLIAGEKGKYLNLTIWVNDEPDQYGNDVSVEQRVAKGEAKIYIGNGRSYKPTSQPVGTPAIQDEGGNDIEDIFK